MIAMQYKIVLPSDYPMKSIEDRIKDKGHLLNGFPGLMFKAYLYSRKNAKVYENPVNSYAPFYLWKDHQSMMSFLNCDGFKALCDQFGRPKVDIWFVDEEPIMPTSEHTFACISHKPSQHADVLGTNYDSWETLSVKWFSDPADLSSQEGDCYCLGYIASG